MNNIELIEETQNRINSLTKILEESGRTVISLNRIIADYTSSKRVETKKKNDLTKNINRLKVKLEKLKELE